MLSWKYTIPAFVVPFAFTVDPRGLGLLLQAPAATIATSLVTASIGVVATAVAAGGWIRQRASLVERILSGIAAALLFVPSIRTAAIGAVLLAVVVATHSLRITRTRTPAPVPEQ
jgi:TRAP-type uncharacterized transport system fused permease subunit